MSRTAVVSQGRSTSVDLDELPTLTKLKSNEPSESAPPTTFGRTLSTTNRPRKFNNDGRRSEEWKGKLANMTSLQKHAAYFLPHPAADVIYPVDTYWSVRAWGWSLPLVLLTVAIIHLGLGYFTQPANQWLPDPRLPCYVQNMHRAKHGSDSGSYNSKGNFKRELFNDFFDNYDTQGKGGLTLSELYTAWRGQRCVFDAFGWSAAAFEWVATYLLLWPADGVLRKSDAEGVFDGEIFWRIKELEDERRVQRGLKPLVY